VVVPQFQQYLSLQDELRTQTQKLNVLKTNYIFLANLDETKSAADFSALSLALPAGKDFAGIMNAVSYASAKTGVVVGDFEFSVGSLSDNTVMQGVSAYPSIKIDINLIGNTQAIVQFIQELYKTAPASEVTSIKTGGNSGSISILFYYKPFSQQNVNDSAPITVLSARDLSLITSVSSWNNSLNQPMLPLTSTVFSGLPATEGAALGNNTSPF